MKFENIVLKMVKEMNKKKRIEFILCGLISVIGAILVSSVLLKSYTYDNIKKVELKVSEDVNASSMSNQIRISSIMAQSGTKMDLEQMARNNGWIYDEALHTLSYYNDDNNKSVCFEMENARLLTLTVVKQNSSGKLDIYCDGEYNKTIDLYSENWENETISIMGERDWATTYVMLLFSFCLFFAICRIGINLIDFHAHWKEKKKKICLFWIGIIIVGEIIAVLTAVYLYPQKVYDFTDEKYKQTVLTDFVLEDGRLQSVSDDPNLTINFDEKNIWIKNVSINVTDLASDQEWAQAFVLYEDGTSADVAYFLKNGKNQISFPLNIRNGKKAKAIRLDLVSHNNLTVQVNSIVLNEKVSVAIWASKFMLLVFLVIAFVIISAFIIKNGVRGDRVNIFKAYLFCLNPLVLICIVQSVDYGVSMITLEVWIATYIVLILLQLLLWQIVISEKVTLIIVDILWMLLGCANHFVTEFRGMPLVSYDLLNVGTAAEVVENYKLNFTKEIVLGIVALTVFLFAVSRSLSLMKKNEKRIEKTRKCKRDILKILVKRVGISVICIILLSLFPASGHFGVQGATMSVQQVYEKNGFILGFVSSYKRIEKPKDYSAVRVKSILENNQENLNNKVNNQELPNIIIIMNESFSDLRITREYATSCNPIGFVDSLDDNVIKGNCHVSVLGGGTSNSEFEALTGNTISFLPQGTNAYTQYCRGDVYSLPGYLKSLGYACVAEHPCAGSNYNRDNVYKYMGFDEFFDESAFENAAKIRYISDQATYDKIIDVYEKKEKNQPLFMFDVTMQNHGSYSTTTAWKEPVRVLNGDYPETEEYLSSIHVSDRAIEELVSYFEKEEEPTIILFFGDHQPALNDGFRTSNKSTGMYEDGDYITPFFIWANYKIETRLNVEASSNYLPMLLLEQTNIDQTPYFSFLKAMYQEIPVITTNGYMDENGTWYHWEDSSEYQQILEDYQVIQYANFVDKSKGVQELLTYQ